MKTLRNVILVLSFVMIFFSANAQYSGPGTSGQSFTVKSIIDNASKLDKNDTMVSLTGYIIEKKGNENYIFKDATGSIRVEIDDEDLHGLKISDKTKVNIVGEVDSDIWDGVEIEVNRISLIK